jgi:hypothetical protein
MRRMSGIGHLTLFKRRCPPGNGHEYELRNSTFSVGEFDFEVFDTRAIARKQERSVKFSEKKPVVFSQDDEL